MELRGLEERNAGLLKNLQAEVPQMCALTVLYMSLDCLIRALTVLYVSLDRLMCEP